MIKKFRQFENKDIREVKNEIREKILKRFGGESYSGSFSMFGVEGEFEIYVGHMLLIVNENGKCIYNMKIRFVTDRDIEWIAQKYQDYLENKEIDDFKI